jgi:tungstate transport system substrate-binding protein
MFAKKRYIPLAILLIFMLSLAGCAKQTAEQPVPTPANPNLILATTTSTQDSGLLDVLIPEFQKQTGYVVKTVAVGSGAALTMGQNGEADVLLVHSPAAEQAVVDSGAGTNYKLVMHNDFIIIGPASDPAGIKGTATAVEALKKISAKGSIFISRGDKSGTDVLEKGLWKTAGIPTTVSATYQETGQGMGATLTIAEQKSAYTISDRATYLAQKKNLTLVPLVEGDKALLNIYHVMTVNPDKYPKVNAAGGLAFDNFMVAPATQQLIANYGVAQYGQQLFYPDAGKNVADLGK